MQQSASSDMQLLQWNMMFKQFQELQQQREIQQFGDTRHQNPLNQLSGFPKQAATNASQLSPPINGTPVHDTSQMFGNWVQRGSSQEPGIPHRLLFSQEQGQALQSIGPVPHLHDLSLYGTPIATARGDLSQHSRLQEISNDSVNLLTSSSGQVQKHTMQPSNFSNPFLRNQHTNSAEQAFISQGTFISKQGLQGRNIRERDFSGNAQEVDSLETTGSLQEFTQKQNQSGWPIIQQSTKPLAPTPSFVPLDPLEEKILYNMEDSIWDAPLSRSYDMGTGVSGNSLEHVVPTNTSNQSGSWSALMQSAVAESSSGDTGVQEEWSGLIFQHKELPNGNMHSNFMNSGKQHTGWDDSNSKNPTFTPEQFPMINGGNINSSLPIFEQAAVQFSPDGRECARQDGSHGSAEYCTLQQKPSVVENQQAQPYPLEGQIYMNSESNPQNQRIASQNNAGPSFGKLEGNAALHQGTLRNGFSWKSEGNNRERSFDGLIRGKEQVQPVADRTQNNRENSQTTKFSAGTNSSLCKSNLLANQYVPDSTQTDYKEPINVSWGVEGNESAEKVQQMRNSPYATHNLYKEAHETYEKQKNCYQNENSHTCHNSEKLAGHEKQNFAQLKSLSDFSSSSKMNKGCVTDMHRKLKAHEDATSRNDRTANFHSQNMLNLFHKGDQLREDSTVAYFGSNEFVSSSERPGAEASNASAPQAYTQPSSSQGIGLRLTSPSQQLLRPNLTQSSWQTQSNLNSIDSKSGTKNRTWFSPPSLVQSLSSSRREPLYDTQHGTPGRTGNSSFLNMQAGSIASSMPSAVYSKHQPEMPPMSNVPSAPSSVILPSKADRFPHFSSASSQQKSTTNPLGQQFEASGAVPVSHPSSASSMIQQAGISVGPDIPCKNETAQLPPSDIKALDISSNILSSLDSSNKGFLSSSSAPQGLADGNCEKGEYGVNNYGVPSGMEPGSSHEEEQAAKARYVQQTSTRMPDAPQTGGSPLGLVQSSNTTMLNFLMGARESANVKALQVPGVRDTSPHTVTTFGQNNSQDQLSKSNIVSNHVTDQSKINPQMAPSWFKQFGSLRNGQMVPMNDARLGKTSVGQFSLGNPSQYSHVRPSIGCVDGADASNYSKVLQRTDSSAQPNENLAPRYLSPSDAVSQGVSNHNVAIVKQKKRKVVTIEPLPWHQEVIHRLRGLQTICIAEEEWAQATNRLIEKVQDEVEMLEDVQQLPPSKRRLIMTTGLMQQLFRPAPAKLFSGNAISDYDSIVYFVSKLAIGDACSLATSTRNQLPVDLDEDGMEMANDSKKNRAQQLYGVGKELICRTNKLTNEFERLEKAASVVDVRVECQDMERFSVINRFARFHGRGQLDMSITPRPLPQRYVTAVCFPKQVPEDLQCLSL